MATAPHIDRLTATRAERARDLCTRAESRVIDAAHDAKRLALEALYLLEADAAAPPVAVAEVLLALGPIRELLGELDAAETTYRRVLALLENSPGQPRLESLHTSALARLGQVYCLQGRYQDADALSARRSPDASAA